MSVAPSAGPASLTLPGLRDALVAVLGAPVRALFWLLDRLVAVLDSAPAAQLPGAVRLRRMLGAATFAVAILVTLRSVRQGGMVSPGGILMLVLAVAVYTNRGGRFVRDWLPVVLAFLTYSLVAKAVPELGLAVHYTPQIEAERVVAFGTLPTIWLQDALYQGTTGALEIFSLLMYMSHFVAPVLLACLIWLCWPGRGFHDLLYGTVIVSFLSELAFLAAPTAPPWLAAERGLIPPVDPVLKQTLADVGLHELAAAKGDASLYNIVAAVPSLHVAWPVIALLVVRKHGLPRYVFRAQALLLAGIVFAIVYTGEHYFVDAVAGAAFALVAWWLVQWALARGPSRLHGSDRVLAQRDAQPKVRAGEVAELPPDLFRSH